MTQQNKPKFLDVYKAHSKHEVDHTKRIIDNAGEAFGIVAEYLKTKMVSPKYLRADMDGYNRALQEVVDILKPKQGW